MLNRQLHRVSLAHDSIFYAKKGAAQNRFFSYFEQPLSFLALSLFNYGVS